ncbi:MAG: TIGR00295 family protein [Candidatus Altiarchaeales archaeon]|nr:MAG: TIGR00295 family protein [Candidatus Altiarchaeales archaeon]RLI93926.1 MAG: TIGR00295 family protein [Candidatus Altiarchaeales archaeon]RLI94190.1 MAG: TIGR00295 family protein [Candidatus Altiarchaeales archaeon]HDO82400.1 TIGR00295 family protein [Candidatus Altiarchaeales archaeon]HEX55049.1 TIGR00295 family protein [Candidatus Altiarchaeales archaeon]
MQESDHYLKRRDAIALLRDSGCSESVIEHSLAVSKLAKKIANKIKKNGYDIDVEFVEIASILHDIGRCKTHGIRHGIEGARILRSLKLDRFARVCEVHIGAGLTKEEAISLGLPAKSYLPRTIEEKVVAHADNLISHNKIVSIQETLGKLEKELGKNHPAIKRVEKLNNFIENLCKNKNKKERGDLNG